jgi:hypothetical protein
VPLAQFDTKKTNVTAEFARVNDISEDQAKDLQSQMSFEDYYDLLNASVDGDEQTMKTLYEKYAGQQEQQEESTADNFLKVWNSSENADAKKRKILNILKNMSQEQILQLGEQLWKMDQHNTINGIYNMIFGKFPSGGDAKDHMLKIYDYIRGHKEKIAEKIIRHPFLRHISESNLPNRDQLLKEGFNYYAAFESTDLTENLLDWLEENKYNFLINEKGHFDIKCEDRDRAYRLGDSISKLMKKYHHGTKFMRDSATTKELVEKDAMAKDKKVPESKKQPIRQNPAAAALSNSRYQAKRTKTKGQIEKQKDRASRKAKHKLTKNDYVDEGTRFEVGETVLFENEQAEVVIANGPMGSVGIMLNNKLTMVGSVSLSRLDESVLGFSGMPTITRLQELAGMDPQTFVMTVEDGDEIEENPKVPYQPGRVFQKPYTTGGTGSHEPNLGMWTYTIRFPDGTEHAVGGNFDSEVVAYKAMGQRVKTLNTLEESQSSKKYLPGKIIRNPWKIGAHAVDPKMGDWCYTVIGLDGKEETVDDSQDTAHAAKAAMRKHVEELNKGDEEGRHETAMQAGMGHGIDAYNDAMGNEVDEADENSIEEPVEEPTEEPIDGDEEPIEEPMAGTSEEPTTDKPEATPPETTLSPAVDQSENFKKAIAMLDEIHQLVTEMRLSEYKIFVQRLGDFTQRIQRLGRDYLR